MSKGSRYRTLGEKFNEGYDGIRWDSRGGEKMEKLRPCPFCGDEEPYVEPQPSDSGEVIFYGVWCDNCGTNHNDAYLSEETAVHGWNTRPLEDV